jgi:hypothetical protein
MKKSISIFIAVAFTIMTSCTKDSNDSGETGTGGSMARFTIKGNYLYTVDNETLHTFDISNPANVAHLHEQYLGFGIETIFPTENHLFIGARNGMYIYDLSNPAKPVKKSFTPHFVSYDPVVVQDNYAYVTLRTGEESWSGVNLLQIYDVSHSYAPVLLFEYEMAGPKGLGIDGDNLFVCDDVLKIFKITNGYQLELITSFDIQALDVIPVDEHLYVVAQDGFYQYSYNGDTIEFISKLTLPENPEQ